MSADAQRWAGNRIVAAVARIHGAATPCEAQTAVEIGCRPPCQLLRRLTRSDDALPRAVAIAASSHGSLAAWCSDRHGGSRQGSASPSDRLTGRPTSLVLL